jgi:hypothetical protein
VDFACAHTFSAEQIEWFAAGSALNVIRLRHGASGAAGQVPSGEAPVAGSVPAVRPSS